MSTYDNSARAATYREVAARAEGNPGIWQTIRNPSPTTANVVTRIRAGKVSEFPPSLFEARTYTIPALVDGKKQYGAEIRRIEVADEKSVAEEAKARIQENLAQIKSLVAEIERDQRLLS